MDTRRKMFYTGVATIVAVLLTIAITDYGFGLELRGTFFLAVAAALVVSSYNITDYTFFGPVAVFTDATIVIIALMASCSFDAVSVAVIIFAILITGLAYESGIAIPRIFGYFLGQFGAVGFGFYFLLNPMLMVSSGIAGIVLMFASLYISCPQFLQGTRQLENGVA